MSLRTRITALVTAAVGLAVALAALATYATVSRQSQANVDQQLLARAEQTAETIGNPAVQAVLGDRRFGPAVAPLLDAGDVYLAVIGPDGSVRAVGDRSAAFVGDAELEVARGQSERAIRTVAGDPDMRVVTVQFGDPIQGGLSLAQSTAATERLLQRLGVVLLLVGVVGVGLAALSGLAVARAALRPVKRLTAAAEDVARTGIPEPIAVDASGDSEDELARLAVSFNAMLAALSESRARQSRLVADASHELRTPLTSLRTNLDLLAQSDAQAATGGRTLPPEERAALLADVRAQVEEMGMLVGDLVQLARAEELNPSLTASFDLAETVDRAIERVRLRAGEVDVEVSCEPWLVVGDESLMERAVVNLVDNAVRWSPPGGTVTVRLAQGAVEVADEGPGIDPVDLPHVFERFYRSASARAKPGSGLGLAIVQQAADAHGGWAKAGEAPGGGARLVLAVPGQPVVDQPTRSEEISGEDHPIISG